MNAKEDDPPRTLLERLPVLKRPCDLDLLLFFAQHRRTLMSSEQLARLLGYPIKEIARSRDALIAAGLLTETQNPVARRGWTCSRQAARTADRCRPSWSGPPHAKDIWPCGRR